MYWFFHALDCLGLLPEIPRLPSILGFFTFKDNFPGASSFLHLRYISMAVSLMQALSAREFYWSHLKGPLM
jgi:hypothetical protein